MNEEVLTHWEGGGGCRAKNKNKKTRVIWQRFGSNPRSVDTVFVVDKVSMGSV